MMTRTVTAAPLAGTLFLCFFFFPACANDEMDRCDELKKKVAECYPESDVEIDCSAGAMDNYDQISSLSCDQFAEAGKADWASTIGCTSEEYVCYFFFCCDIKRYPITWQESDEDFDIIDEITTFQDQIPSDIQERFDTATRWDLKFVLAETYEQPLGNHDMQVEKTQGIVEVPYASFSTAIPAAELGPNLADYIGGEIRVVQQEQGRTTRQVERMVLSTVTSQLGVTDPLDMTKVESIVYDEQGATVYWKVMKSDNGSVIQDIGSVDFRPYDQDSTLVTFHSAHKLGLGLPGWAVAEYLKCYFSSVISKYGKKANE